MAIFFSRDVHELLENKKLVVIGDSIQRSVYKDLLCLWTQQDSRYLFQRELRAKGELSFLGDKLLHGGKLEGKMVNGIGYREVREFSDGKVFFKYYFVTRSYSEHMASILNELKTLQPDVIVMNSTFWDLHHYGDTDLQQYKENLEKLLKDINEVFSPSLLFIWNAALPLAERCKGGFLRKGFLTIPIDKIKTANKFAWMATTEQKKVYLDLFTELKDRENFQQAEDGIHWGMRAHRKISNLILTEVCTAWNRRTPEPPQVVKRQDNRMPSPVPWSSYYPDTDTDNWNSSPSNSYLDDYEPYYLPYWDSPASFDRYQTPSPVLPGPYSSVNWSYNLPFVNALGRAREYQPFSSPAPYAFQTRYLPIENLQFNFASPQGPYYSEKVLFKPANFSDPLPFGPFRSPQGTGQGLLPTPLGPPSFAFFNEGDGYRDRFKKLSNPRARRYKSSATNTKTPISTAHHTKQSTPSETPQNSLFCKDQNTKVSAVNGTDDSDPNNNQKQKDSPQESCLKVSSNSVDVGKGGPSEDTSKPPTLVTNSNTHGSSDHTVQHEESSDESTERVPVKRKLEDDEELNPCKVAREDSINYQGGKRKRDEAGDELMPLKCARKDDSATVDVVEHAKRERFSEAGSKDNTLALVEDTSIKDTHENHVKEQLPDRVNSPEVSQSEGTFCDVVRCALTYDNFI